MTDTEIDFQYRGYHFRPNGTRYPLHNIPLMLDWSREWVLVVVAG